MGSAAQGRFEVSLGTDQKRIQPAAKRLAKAERMAEKVSDFVDASTDSDAVHIAWAIMQKSLKEALAYDVRVVPRPMLEEILEEHASAIKSAFEAVAGYQTTENQWRRAQLPGPLGGCALALPLASADAAYVATWQATLPRAQAVAAALGRPMVGRVHEHEYVAAFGKTTRSRSGSRRARECDDAGRGEAGIRSGSVGSG